MKTLIQKIFSIAFAKLVLSDEGVEGSV